MTQPPPLRVGILTSGAHPFQTIYLPALHALPTLYTIAAIYTSQPEPSSSSINEIITSPAVNLILNFMPNEYHELYTIAALQEGKHVMVETPLSLSIPSAKRILDAERKALNGARVFVASARRYAPCLESVFKREVRGLERIHYARLRMIAGPHVAHTATNPTTTTTTTTTTSSSRSKMRVGSGRNSHEHENSYNNNNDAITTPNQEKATADRTARLRSLMEEIFGKDEQPNRERVALSRFLASLGCHDLGLMRDTLGYPDAISNVSVNEPFYSALFHYTGGVSQDVHPFTLMYETGTDFVPRCDAHLAVYGQSKTVTVHYDLPYAQGLPVRVVVETADEGGGLKQSETVSTWEEAYHEELKALYRYLIEGKGAKTTARDSLQDIKLFQMIFEQYDRQCGTIRTPLG